MANTVEDRARERLQRARSFLEKAHALMLQDDLVYRSALEDAVSAIKNNLQGYLLQRASMVPAGSAPVYWQEAAASNRMPELLRTCADAGLDLRGLDREIRRLNDERNFRTHDDPLRRVDTTQARQAVDLALMLHRRVQDALTASGARVPVKSIALSSRLPAPEIAKVGIGRAPNPPAAARAASAVAASANGVAIATAPAAPTSAKPAAPPPLAAERRPPAAPDEDDVGGDEDTAERAAVQEVVRRRWVRRFVVRGGSLAAMVLLGAAGGVLLTLAAGGWPGARPSNNGATGPAPTQTLALLPANASLSAGSLLVGAPVCQSGRAAISLRNTGTAPVQFSAGSPDNAGATFALAPATAGQPTAGGALAPNAAATLYVSTAAPSAARYHVVVVASPGGTVQLPAAAC